jgi:hypothetical protein
MEHGERRDFATVEEVLDFEHPFLHLGRLHATGRELHSQVTQETLRLSSINVPFLSDIRRSISGRLVASVWW